MPSKYFSHSLPYRRLQKFANGIWDEERKTFYPFKVRSGTASILPAKKGVHYYVNTVTTEIRRTGINAADAAWWEITNDGTTRVVCRVLSPQLTQATDFFAQSMSQDVGILADAGTQVVASGSQGCIIYAEIPADPAGGSVVIS